MNMDVYEVWKVKLMW